jgi:hypothetical protein
MDSRKSADIAIAGQHGREPECEQAAEPFRYAAESVSKKAGPIAITLA